MTLFWTWQILKYITPDSWGGGLFKYIKPDSWGCGGTVSPVTFCVCHRSGRYLLQRDGICVEATGSTYSQSWPMGSEWGYKDRISLLCIAQCMIKATSVVVLPPRVLSITVMESFETFLSGPKKIHCYTCINIIC